MLRHSSHSCVALLVLIAVSGIASAQPVAHVTHWAGAPWTPPPFPMRAIDAPFNFASSLLAAAPDGSLYLSWNPQPGPGTQVLRYGSDGVLRVFAGSGQFTGTECSTNKGGGMPALSVSLSYIQGLAVGPDGSVYIAECDRLRKVTSDGIMHTFVSGVSDYLTAISADLAGNIYLTCSDSEIQRVDAQGIVHAFASGLFTGPVEASNNGSLYAAGGDSPMYLYEIGSDGSATRLNIALAASPFAAPDGTVYVPTTLGAGTVIQRLNADNTVTPVAGTGNIGYSGDGGASRSADLFMWQYQSATATSSGDIYFMDDQVVRKASAGGTIARVVGNFMYQMSGDGGPALELLYQVISPRTARVICSTTVPSWTSFAVSRRTGESPPWPGSESPCEAPARM